MDPKRRVLGCGLGSSGPKSSLVAVCCICALGANGRTILDRLDHMTSGSSPLYIFCSFHGTFKFITMFTRAYHLSLS